MSTGNFNHPDGTEAIETAAAEWWCERENGLSADRAAAFAAWRDADVRNAAAFERVERAMNLVADLPAVQAPLEARFGPVPGAVTSSTRRRGRLLPWISLGAAAALTVATAWFWRPAASPESAPQRFATHASGPERVVLPDGSIVNLNSASELQVAFSATRRAVTLGAGEAHFEVAHDTARPFVVIADGVAVRAVGTAFNVRLGADAVDVLVTEGRVAVTPALPAATTSETAPVVSELSAGEETSVARDHSRTSLRVNKAAPEAIRAAFAWHSRTRVFSETPLSEVVAQFNRRNTVQIRLEGDLGQRRIGGSFALDDVEAFVRLLVQGGDALASRPGENEIVLRAVE